MPLQEPEGCSCHQDNLILSRGCGPVEAILSLSSLLHAYPCLILSPESFCQSQGRDGWLLYAKIFCINLGHQAQLHETPKGPKYRLLI